MFGTVPLLVQLRLRRVQLRLGFLELRTAGDRCFTHGFTGGFVHGRACAQHCALLCHNLIDLLIELIAILVYLLLRIRELPIGFVSRFVDFLLPRIDEFLPSCFLTIGFRFAFDAVHDFADDGFVGFVERAFVCRTVDQQSDRRIDGAGHAIGWREKRVIARRSRAERGHGRISVRIAQVLRIKHHAHDSQFRREFWRLFIRHH